jgi:hypothetical protein
MALDKQKPADSDPISQGAGVIRDNSEALQGALDNEHEFADGSDTLQTGRHKFFTGTVAQIDARTGIVGSVAIENTVNSTGAWRRWNGTSWEYMQDGSPTSARLDESREWDAVQNYQITQITPIGGQLQVFAQGSPFQWAEVNQDIHISMAAPGSPGGYGSIITLGLDFIDAGNWNVTWEAADFRAPGGVVQLSRGSGQENIVTLQSTQYGTWLATSIPNWNVGGVVTVEALTI